MLPENVYVFDTTLRDGEQSPGISLTWEDKLQIAEMLDTVGVDVIEAGSAITSEGERKGIKASAGAGLRAEICSFARAVTGDVDAALDCDVDSINLVVPVSDLHLERKLKKDREYMIEKTVEVVDYAKSHGLIIELSGEDASRADMEFVKRLFTTAVEAGADGICFCDTVGVMLPERVIEVFQELKSIPVRRSMHAHNDFGLATANGIAALRGGAECVHVTVNGIGERAGNPFPHH